MLVTILIAVFAAGVAIAAYAYLVPRSKAEPVAVSAAPTEMSEVQRVEAVFAAADLESDAATAFLTEALDDPSEAVALAAAHTLSGRGQADLVRTWAATNPGQRSARVLEAADLLRPGSMSD